MPTIEESKTVCLGMPVARLAGIGPRRATLLKRLEIVSVSDLLRHLPLRYEWRLAQSDIMGLTAEQIGCVRGTVVKTRWTPGGKGRDRFQATLEDHSGTLSLTFFGARYLLSKLHPGMVVRVQGKVTQYGPYAQMVNPRWEVLDVAEEAKAQAQDRYGPIYPATENLTSTVIEELIALVLPQALPLMIDPLPGEFLRTRNLPDLATAYRMVHQPQQPDEVNEGLRRLKYNELLLLQLGIASKRHYNQTVLRAPALRWSSAIDQHIRQRFPFQLTAAQDEVVSQISGDLQRAQPMNRLLQGDVGAGKTVVALYALLLAVANRKQGALMAPTELLAEQHFQSIGAMLEGSNVKLALLTGATPDREALLEKIAQGQIDIVLGTQALLTESVRFQDLAVVVIDEQHRFGVLQRASFRRSSGGGEAEGPPSSPHYLVMTATPIPRTLSLTVFGDLDASVIGQLPPGRQKVITKVVGPEKADQVYQHVAQRVARGEQAYVVVPAVDEAGAESVQQLKNVKVHLEFLQDKYFAGRQLAAVHGRLKASTRAAVMQRFRSGEIQVLVATTVIEVGVDVPKASILVVEHAERFGLAQLHQLRGRIGRSADGPRALCVLIAQPNTEQAQQRMAAIASSSDGFQIAELDLQIRGMGDFFGTRQHGLTPLRVAAIPQDLELLQLAGRDAKAMISADPHMALPQHQRLRQLLLQQFGDMLGLVDVG